MQECCRQLPLYFATTRFGHGSGRYAFDPIQLNSGRGRNPPRETPFQRDFICSRIARRLNNEHNLLPLLIVSKDGNGSAPSRSNFTVGLRDVLDPVRVRIDAAANQQILGSTRYVKFAVQLESEVACIQPRTRFYESIAR